jgi:hypothetical protein
MQSVVGSLFSLKEQWEVHFEKGQRRVLFTGWSTVSVAAKAAVESSLIKVTTSNTSFRVSVSL